MERKQQYIAGGVVVIILIAVFSGVGVVMFLQQTGAGGDTLIFGTGAGPDYLDPLDVWDSASANVLDQIAEPLFRYDLEDPDLPIVPTLASAMGTWSGPNYTVSIRQGVKFHDGTPLNATAVQWTFDRIQYFLNATGAILDVYDLAYTTELYLWPNGTHILNHTEVIDTYTVKFCLNYYYAVWEPLLCFTTSYIISPTSHKSDTRIDLDPSKPYVVGTGPFKWVSQTAGDEVRMTRFDDYWQGPSKIKTLVFSIIEDPNARNIALITGDINFLDDPLPELLPLFDVTTGITVERGVRAAQIQYVGFNTHAYNVTWREALSYIVDYDYIIEDIMLDTAVRLKSNIPVGIQYANESLDYAIFNVTRARQVVNSMTGFGYGLDDSFATSCQWEEHINGSKAPIMVTNYSYNADNLVRAQVGLMLQDDLELIGVKCTLIGLSWAAFIRTTYGIPPYSKDDLGLWFLGWIPDYNDPSNFVNPLFTVSSLADDTQLDDATINQWMIDGLVETDDAKREAIYDKIQKRIVEVLRPYGFAYSGTNIDAYASTLHGHPNNGMSKVYFYPCYHA